MFLMHAHACTYLIRAFDRRRALRGLGVVALPFRAHSLELLRVVLVRVALHARERGGPIGVGSLRDRRSLVLLAVLLRLLLRLGLVIGGRRGRRGGRGRGRRLKAAASGERAGRPGA